MPSDFLLHALPEKGRRCRRVGGVLGRALGRGSLPCIDGWGLSLPDRGAGGHVLVDVLRRYVRSKGNALRARSVIAAALRRRLVS